VTRRQKNQANYPILEIEPAMSKEEVTQRLENLSKDPLTQGLMAPLFHAMLRMIEDGKAGQKALDSIGKSE
jgi:hypothetical protein